MNHEHHHMAHVAEASQVLQKKFISHHLKLINRLLKEYRDKKKNEHKIIVKVNGKTKFDAIVDKNGKLHIKRNNLTTDEVQTLQNYFKMMHNPPNLPKDFDVAVDGNRVLLTKNGQVVEKAQPHPEAVEQTAAEPTLTRESPESVERSETETQTDDVNSDSYETETESATPTTPTDEIDDTENLDPIRPEAQDRQPLRTQASEAQQAQSEQLPLPGLTAPPSIPKDTKTGLIPPDYGIEAAKGISWEKLQAGGDQNLMRSYGSLENIRADLNDSYERANTPGFEWIAKVPHIAPLEQRLAEEIPIFEAKLKQSIQEGKYSAPEAVAAQTAVQTKTATPEAVPLVNETGIVPQDYGLGKVITDGAIVATGDRALVSAHGRLEAKRLELNDCVRRGVDPGFSHLNERATVLRTEINRDLPKFSELLNQSIEQGKYNPARRSAPGLDHDMPLTPKQQQTQDPSQSKTQTQAQDQAKKRVLAKR